MAKDLVNAERRILTLLKNGRRSSVDVVDELRRQHFDDLIVRDAIWRLIGSMEVELTPKRELRVVAPKERRVVSA
ncbi:MAG TPA: hypothetical protein VI056_05530 [Candidatus Limnocylindria bacterium]